MRIHVITPFTRFQNLDRLIELIEPQKIQWHIILDADQHLRIDPGQLDWITISEFLNPHRTTPWACYAKLNHWIDNALIVDSDRYCFLNDDDAYEPGFFDKIRDMEDGVIITSMKRGNRTPEGVSAINAHGADTLVAAPENVQIGRIGGEQIFVTGKVLREFRFNHSQCADGELVCAIAAHYPVRYVPDAFVWFNYLEQGRWDAA